jgi:hypothetical protein
MNHKHEKSNDEPRSHGSKNKFNGWMVVSFILLIASVLFLVLWLTKGGSAGAVSENQIRTEMKTFIDENLLQQGMTSTIESVEDIGGMYKVIVNVQGQNITSYASKDGKIFFPSGYNIAEVKAAAATQGNQNAQPAAANVPKTDKPVVEMFVMSYCPYGTQIEKGMLPVVDLLGSKADIQVKFVDYAMHGQKEVDENILQYCVQQTYKDQYYKYLQCFLNDSNAARCVKELGFDQAKLDSCISATDTKFNISKDYADKSTWRGSFPSFSINEAENQKYGVQGSPTLVVNGVVVNSARDSESLKGVICNAFTDKPAECDTALSTAGPSAGFGFGTSGTDAAAAGCGV